MSGEDDDYKLILEKSTKYKVVHIKLTVLSGKSFKILFYNRLLNITSDSKTFRIDFIWANRSAYKDEEG